MRIQAFAMGVVLALAAAGGARADDVLFTVSNGGKTVASFELPLDPTPNGPIPIWNFSFNLASVSAVVGGSPKTLANLTFYGAQWGGGGFFAAGVFNFSGQQLYSGLETSPTFTPGSYQLLNAATRKTETVTLELFRDPTPDPPTVSIPEPSTWAMLLLGFVGLGFAGYRKATARTIS